ncbi:HlyD family efflux transporter periplasmic adaptor subunit [Spirulina major CS-329]|uniref:HlyD family efflux transporter periplasmic adaptor subunit n=1 Tax=Spirulina TaxID=1154 RepID=UPI002330AB61|nr:MULTISPECIES: HlyD family efflux transporter periplasmic adaptor subunit [Spirulina]MDB9496752.1 HlyD family efflux transporter periplasmic adaptor subunit [Spirulina subsalsa CS-330]MDB9504172.1 HlyD family efflux transporter periplasmic adaptor subunit [Spirulina major CS-329]
MNGNGFKHNRNLDQSSSTGKFVTLPPLPSTQDPSPSSSALVPQRSPEQATALVYPEFDQPVVLRQSPRWSRMIIWTVVGVVTFGVGWACIAEIEQVASATGQLKPEDAVKEVQAPVEGVVQQVFVEEGDRVEPGDLLVRFDSGDAVAELQSSVKVRQSLLEENRLYRSVLAEGDSAQLVQSIVKLNLPPDVLQLTRNRQAVLEENRFYQAELSGNGAGLGASDQARLQTANAELRSRSNASQLATAQIRQELEQTQLRLQDTRAALTTDQRVLQEIQARNRSAIAQAQESLQLEEGILANMAPLANEAIANVQVEQQRQRVNDRRATLQDLQRNDRIEIQEQQQQIASRRSEIDQLQEELRRLQLDIAQGREESANTTIATQKNVRDAIATNNKRLADIDSQLTQSVLNVIVENEKQVAEIDSRIAQIRQRLRYQEVRAAVAGTVFDLQAFNGFVANSSELLLSIVPEDNLVAEVFVTNQDIGFVRDNMRADIRIDSFPFSEFGDIKGDVLSISSDALPPDEIYQYFRFPVTVRLDQQMLSVADRDIPLKSGMAVSVNIKVRENRKVISLFIELFTDKVESLKQVR